MSGLTVTKTMFAQYCYFLGLPNSKAACPKIFQWECFLQNNLHRVSTITFHLWLAITLTHINGLLILFGTNVTDKVGNQKTLYYATWNNLCFCTTWGNRKPGNCIFLHKCCMLFHRKNTKHSLKYHPVRAEPSLTIKMIDWVHQTGPRREYSLLLSDTHMFCVSQVRHGVSRCVKGGSCSSSSLE